MEILVGFMVMMSIISLFLAVVWLIMPFVVFAIKGQQERTFEILEGIDKRLASLEAHFQSIGQDVSMHVIPPAQHQADNPDAYRVDAASSKDSGTGII